MSGSDRELQETRERDALDATRHWIETIVVGLNLCPFAKPVLDASRARFQLSAARALEPCLFELLHELQRLDRDDDIATTILIYPHAFADWQAYLDLVDVADELVRAEGYEGIYQLASFHPEYQFADTVPEDPANLTNRSPYPLLHILREADVERSLAEVASPASIPARNQRLCRKLGADGIRALLARPDSK